MKTSLKKIILSSKISYIAWLFLCSLIFGACKSRKSNLAQHEQVPTSIFPNHLTKYVVNALDFGAIPNDSKDDTESIQNAINHAITNSKKGEPSIVYLPPGVYDISQSIVIAQKTSQNNKEYFYVTLSLIGHTPAYTDDLNIGNVTILRSRKAIAYILVQQARQCNIENIVFSGSAQYEQVFANILDADTSDWGGLANARINQYSPSCAIGIDPFHINIPASDRYHGLDKYYTNNRRSGSSMVLIRGCAFKYHYIAIAHNISGWTLNGDNVRAEMCHVKKCHTFWACGQTQSRGNSIDNVYSTGVHTFVDGVSIGSGRGTPPTMQNLNLAGFTKYLVNVRTHFSGISVNQSYGEKIWSLGSAVCNFVSFNQCQFKFLNPSEDLPSAPILLHSDASVTFNDCSIEYFSNCREPMPFLFSCQSVNINGGWIEGGVVTANSFTNAGGDLLHNIDFNNVRIKCKNSIADDRISGYVPIRFKGHVMTGGTEFVDNKGKSYNKSGTTYNVFHFEKAKISETGIPNEVEIESNNPKMYQIGDNLFTDKRIVVKDMSPNPIPIQLVIGYVSEINGSTIKVKGVPQGFVFDQLDVYKIDYPIFFQPFEATCVNKSNMVTCVSGIGTEMLPNVGTHIFSPAFQPGTYVTKVDVKTKSIQLSSLSMKTGTFNISYE